MPAWWFDKHQPNPKCVTIVASNTPVLNSDYNPIEDSHLVLPSDKININSQNAYDIRRDALSFGPRDLELKGIWTKCNLRADSLMQKSVFHTTP